MAEPGHESSLPDEVSFLSAVQNAQLVGGAA